MTANSPIRFACRCTLAVVGFSIAGICYLTIGAIRFLIKKPDTS